MTDTSSGYLSTSDKLVRERDIYRQTLDKIALRCADEEMTMFIDRAMAEVEALSQPVEPRS